MLHCCLAFQSTSSDYYQHAWISMLSCIHTTSAPLCFHLVIDGLTDEILLSFQNLCATHGHELKVYDPPVIPHALLEHVPPQFGPGCLYVCALHEIIAEPEVLYIDGDVLFARDIAELASTHLADKSVAAALDVSLIRHRKKFDSYYKRLKLDVAHYINSGVLLLNLDRLRYLSRTGNIFWQAFEDVRQFWPDWHPLFPDQDLFNLALGNCGEVQLMDESFNWLVNFRHRRFLKPKDMQGKILHFAGIKPWRSVFPACTLWWNYEAQSPWAADALQRLSGQLEEENMDVAWYALQHPGSVKRLRRFFSLFNVC